MRRTALAAAVTAALTLGGAATAAADSLVFTKEHNVWLANTDGSSQYQVTTDGTADNPWLAPAQADDGTIVATRRLPASGKLYRLRQNGDLVNEIPLDPMQFGPFDPAVSPNGRQVAYGHNFARYVNGYLETGTDVRYTSADGYTDSTRFPGVGTNATTPSWIDDGRTLVGRGPVAYTQVPGQAAVQWWSDYDHVGTYFPSGNDLSDGEAVGSRVVMLRGLFDDNTIQLYTGTPGAKPSPTCTISDPPAGPNGKRFVDPTLSSDGRRLFWQGGDGIYTATFADDSCTGVTIKRIIDGGAAPDYGPANVNPGPRTPAPPVTPPGGGGGGGGGGAGGGGGGGVAAGGGRAGGGTTVAPTTKGCTALTGAKRETCVYQAAVKACAKVKGKSKRAACTLKAKRARAASKCKRTTKGKARTKCLARAKKLR